MDVGGGASIPRASHETTGVRARSVRVSSAKMPPGVLRYCIKLSCVGGGGGRGIEVSRFFFFFFSFSPHTRGDERDVTRALFISCHHHLTFLLSSVPPHAYAYVCVSLVAARSRARTEAGARVHRRLQHMVGRAVPQSDSRSARRKEQGRSLFVPGALFFNPTPTQKNTKNTEFTFFRSTNEMTIGWLARAACSLRSRYGKSAALREHGRPAQKEAATRCIPRMDSGRTKGYEAKQRTFCLHFARGACVAGYDCAFLHHLPTGVDDANNDMLHDIFGREKHRDDRDDNGGTGFKKLEDVVRVLRRRSGGDLS